MAISFGSSCFADSALSVMTTIRLSIGYYLPHGSCGFVYAGSGSFRCRGCGLGVGLCPSCRDLRACCAAISSSGLRVAAICGLGVWDSAHRSGFGCSCPDYYSPVGSFDGYYLSSPWESLHVASSRTAGSGSAIVVSRSSSCCGIVCRLG